MSGATKTQQEVQLVRAALQRYETKLQDEFPYVRGQCCQGCAYGDPYAQLCDKIERVEAWLRILIKKVVASEEARHRV